jgi:hypothetical protein
MPTLTEQLIDKIVKSRSLPVAAIDMAKQSRSTVSR